MKRYVSYILIFLTAVMISSTVNAKPPSSNPDTFLMLENIKKAVKESLRERRIERMRYKGAPWHIYYIPTRKIWWAVRVRKTV